MTEQELVTLCKRGDRRALQILYDQYAPLMMGVAMRYIGNSESSKDVLHDSFVKILESVNRFEYRGVGSLNAWVKRIVVNSALTALKRDSSFNVPDNIDQIADIPELEDDVGLYAAVSETVIIEQIGKLPHRLRVVFNLFIFENLPHSDIAEQLKISESASRVRIHRAKVLLAEALRKQISENKK